MYRVTRKMREKAIAESVEKRKNKENVGGDPEE